MNRKKFTGHGNSKCCSYQTFSVNTFGGTCFEIFKVNIVLAKTYVRQWCLFKVHIINSLGMSYSKITPTIFFWNVSFSSKRNFIFKRNHIFLLIPFLLAQFIDFRTSCAQSSINSNDTPFFYNNVGLSDRTTLFLITITRQRLMAVREA